MFRLPLSHVTGNQHSLVLDPIRRRLIVRTKLVHVSRRDLSRKLTVLYLARPACHSRFVHCTDVLRLHIIFGIVEEDLWKWNAFPNEWSKGSSAIVFLHVLDRRDTRITISSLQQRQAYPALARAEPAEKDHEEGEDEGEEKAGC